MSMFKIEDGVEIPPRKHGPSISMPSIRGTVNCLRKGQSFFAVGAKGSSVHAIVSRASSANGMKYTTRFLEEEGKIGIRVWCLGPKTEASE